MAVIRRPNWSRITAGVVGIVAGLIGMIDGFETMGSVSGTPYALGVVLLALLSVVVLAAAVLVLLLPRQASAVPTMPSMPPVQPPQS